MSIVPAIETRLNISKPTRETADSLRTTTDAGKIFVFFPPSESEKQWRWRSIPFVFKESVFELYPFSTTTASIPERDDP